MTLAANTDVPDKLIFFVLDVAVGRVVGFEVDDCSLTGCRAVPTGAG